MRPTGQGEMMFALALGVLLAGAAMAGSPSPDDRTNAGYPSDPFAVAAEQQMPLVPPGAENPGPTDPRQGFSGTPVPAPGPSMAWGGAPSCSAPGPGYDGYSCPPIWYFGAGAHILGRTRADKMSLTRDGLSSATVMTTRSESFDGAPGGYAVLGRYLGLDSSNRNHFLEFDFWTENQWETDHAANSVGQVNYGTSADPVIAGSLTSFFPQTLSGFTGSDTQQYDYDSRLLNFELNYWIRPRGRPDRLVLYPNGKWYRERNEDLISSFMFGVRGMTLDEDFTFTGESHVTTNAGTTDGFGKYRIDTQNDLVGIQIGADVIQHGRRWEWGFQAKAAPMVNFAEQNSHLLAEGNPSFVNTERRWEGSEGKIAFLGEVGMRGKYWLTPAAAVSAAYNAYWLTGVAMAPEQLTFATFPTGQVNDEHLVFMHGLSLGLELNY